MVNAPRSHKNQFGDRGDRMTPAWDSQHLLYLPNMWPVAGTPVTFVRAPQGNYGNREVKPCPARTRTHGQNRHLRERGALTIVLLKHFALAEQ